MNARRFPDVLNAIRNNFNPAHDFLLLSTTSQDTLDFTSFKMNLGSKMILDATSSTTNEYVGVGWPAPKPFDLNALRRIDGRIAVLELSTIR